MLHCSDYTVHMLERCVLNYQIVLPLSLAHLAIKACCPHYAIRFQMHRELK